MREIILQLCDPVIKMAGDLYSDHPRLKFPTAHHPARIYERRTYLISDGFYTQVKCTFLALCNGLLQSLPVALSCHLPSISDGSASLQRNRGLPDRPMKRISLGQPSMLHLPGEEHSCGHEGIAFIRPQP